MVFSARARSAGSPNRVLAPAGTGSPVFADTWSPVLVHWIPAGHLVSGPQRWDGEGEVLECPGALVYWDTQKRAMAAVEALVLRVIADRLESSKRSPFESSPIV